MKIKYNNKSRYKKYIDIFLKETNENLPISLDINSNPLIVDEWYYTISKNRLFLFQYKETLIDIPYYAPMSTKRIIINNDTYYYSNDNMSYHWNNITYVLSGIKSISVFCLEDIFNLTEKNFKYMTIKTDIPFKKDIPRSFTIIPLQNKYKQHLESL